MIGELIEGILECLAFSSDERNVNVGCIFFGIALFLILCVVAYFVPNLL